MTDGSIVINTALDTKGLVSGIKTMKNQVTTGVNSSVRTVTSGVDTVTRSLQRVKGLVLTIFGIGSLVAIGKQALELSSSITEVDNVVSKAFGNMRDEMDALADSAVSTLGMSRLTAYQTGSMFMQFGKTMLGDEEQAKDMAIALTKLTANLASFRNESTDTIKVRLKGIYTGETEAIEELGISIRETTLSAYALQKGMTKSYSSMTDAEKIALRYEYVMEQLAYVGDDFLDTQDSWANQTRILTENWKELLTVIGDGLVAVLKPVVQVLNQILSSLITITKYVGSVLGKFFNIQKDTSASASTSSDSYEDASDAMSDYGDAISSASSSAKNALANFDELNTLASSSSGSSSSSSSTGLDVDDIDTSDIVSLDEIEQELEDAINSWYELGQWIAEGLNDWLSQINWSDIEKNARELGENLAELLNGFFSNNELAVTLGKSIAGAINSAINLAYGFVSTFNWKQFGRWLGTLVDTGVRETDWDLIGAYIGTKINGICESIIGFFETFHPENLANGITTMFNKAVDTVDADTVANALGTTLWNAFDLIDRVFNGAHLTEAVNKIIDIIAGVFTYVEDDESLAQKVGSTIATIVNKGIDLVVNGDVSELISAFTQFFFDGLYEAINDIDAQALANALQKILLEIPMDMVNSVAREGTIFILKLFGLSDEDAENIRERMADAKTTGESFKNDMQSILGVDESTMSTGEQYVKHYNDALTELSRNTNEFCASGLVELQEKYGLADEAMDRIINTTSVLYSEQQLANRGLADYNGSWAEFTANADQASESMLRVYSEEEQANQKLATYNETLSQFSTKTDEASTKQDNLFLNTQKADELFTKMDSTLKTTTDSTDKLNTSVKKYIDIGDEVASSNKVNASLSETKEKTEGVSIAFEGLSESTQASLDEISESIDTWFNETIANYFSEDTWTTFGENINLAMAEALTTFMETWTEQFTTWNESNLELYFGYDLWYTTIDENILQAYRDTWEVFNEEWIANMDVWKTTYVEPYFSVDTWTQYGNNMREGIKGGFKAIVSDVAGILGTLTDVFNGQMSAIADAVNQMISQVNSMASQLKVSTISSVSWSNIPHVSVPALATGAVLPANNPFMAIVGDQKSGTNVEAPLDTIKQAVREVLGSGSSGTGDVYISADGDLDAIVRLFKLKIENESSRVGRSFRKASGT